MPLIHEEYGRQVWFVDEHFHFDGADFIWSLGAGKTFVCIREFMSSEGILVEFHEYQSGVTNTIISPKVNFNGCIVSRLVEFNDDQDVDSNGKPIPGPSPDAVVGILSRLDKVEKQYILLDNELSAMVGQRKELLDRIEALAKENERLRCQGYRGDLEAFGETKVKDLTREMIRDFIEFPDSLLCQMRRAIKSGNTPMIESLEETHDIWRTGYFDDKQVT